MMDEEYWNCRFRPGWEIGRGNVLPLKPGRDVKRNCEWSAKSGDCQIK